MLLLFEQGGLHPSWGLGHSEEEGRGDLGWCQGYRERHQKSGGGLQANGLPRVLAAGMVSGPAMCPTCFPTCCSG